MSSAKGVRLAVLMDMTAAGIASIETPSLRKTYQNLRKIVGSRVDTFERKGAGEAVPKHLRGGLPSAKGRSDADLVQDIREAIAWMRGKRSTYKGYEEVKESFREKMQDAMPDLDLSDEDKFDAFGRFMGEMQDRYGEMWHAISNAARDVYKEQTKLNKDPKQFMKNYDYWVQQTEQINAEKSARRQGGRRRSTKLSTYMRQLKRGKIK